MTGWDACVLAIVLVLATTVLLSGALAMVHPRRLGILYRAHLSDPRKERLLVASAAFFVTFAVVRWIAHAIHGHHGPFHDVSIDGVHVHHLVWGILLLMLVGYLWLLQVGTGTGGGSRANSCLTAAIFGIGSALTLDEFALWVHLTDVYWASDGRESIDAVLLFGAILSMGVGGGAFAKGLVGEVLRLAGRGR
jgi:hypothetical protein